MKQIYILFLSLFFIHPNGTFAGGGDGDDEASVKLIYAEGKIFDHEVIIQWTTELEKSQVEFLIERSKDKLDWAIRGKMKANGSQSLHSEYSYKDDRDDQYKYYRIRTIEHSGMKTLREFELQNYSITVNLNNVQVAKTKHLVIEYDIDKDQEILLRIYNKIGEQVITRMMPFHEAGEYIYHLDIDHLKKGNYLLVVTQTLLDKSIAEKQFRLD